jgi:uncharacterized membrane protein
MGYKYKLTVNEADPKRAAFQQERIKVFDEITAKLNKLYPMISNAKDETITYYNENPGSYGIVYGTDLIKKSLEDIEITLNKGQE